MSAPGVLKIRRAEGEGLTNYQGELTPISPSHFTSQPGANAMWLQVGESLTVDVWNTREDSYKRARPGSSVKSFMSDWVTAWLTVNTKHNTTYSDNLPVQQVQVKSLFPHCLLVTGGNLLHTSNSSNTGYWQHMHPLFCDFIINHLQRHLLSVRHHYLVVPRHSLSSYGVGHLLLPAQLPVTHWVMICVIRRLTLTSFRRLLKTRLFSEY